VRDREGGGARDDPDQPHLPHAIGPSRRGHDA
jgi:hypothetical protein